MTYDRDNRNILASWNLQQQASVPKSCSINQVATEYAKNATGMANR